MASFVSNIVDSDGNAIDCKYVGFHYETGNVSNEHTTENQQISFDNEDADWDGQGVVFADGDVIILYAYTDDACALVKVISNGGNSYTIDMQLKGCIAPTCSITSGDATIGVEYTATSSSSDEYQWEYSGNTMYQKKSWFGRTWCDLGIVSTEYDFGDGYSAADKHTFSTSEEVAVKCKVTNKCGLTAEDSKNIKVLKRAPICVLGNNPVKPSVNEDTTITVDVSDVDNTIVEEKWYMDDVETTDLVHSFNQLGSHVFKDMIKWNDGFDEHIMYTNLAITLDNAAPIVNLVVRKAGNSYALVSNANDPEDNLEIVRFKIYIDANAELIEYPDDSRWVEILTRDLVDGSVDSEAQFYKSGKFKISVQAYDGSLWSNVSADYVEVDCVDGGSTPANGEIRYVELKTIGKAQAEIQNIYGNIDSDILTANADIEPSKASMNIVRNEASSTKV